MPAVEISAEVQQMALHAHVLPFAHRRANADVGDRRIIGPVVQPDPGRVDAVLWDDDARRKGHVDRRAAELGPQVEARVDHVGEGVRVAEKTVGFLDLPVRNQAADLGRTHDPSVILHGRDHVTADVPLCAPGLQPFRRPLSAVAEGKIVSHHHRGDPEFPDGGLNKLLPGHLHHAPIEMQKDRRVDAVDAADDLFPLRRAVDQGDFFSEHKGIRMDVKGKHRGGCVQLCRTFLHPLQQGRVSPVYSVKKAERYRSAVLVHVD